MFVVASNEKLNKMTSNSTGTTDTYPPPQLKGFHIEKRLGTGTYASVYKAISKVTYLGTKFPSFFHFKFNEVLKILIENQ